MDLLEMPGVLAGLGIHCDHRGAEQVVSFAYCPVVVRAAVASREVYQPELWIERWRVPDRGSSAHIGIAASRPGIAAVIVWPWKGIESPQYFAGLGVERRQAAT